jgi:hypothetical protein
MVLQQLLANFTLYHDTRIMPVCYYGQNKIFNTWPHKFARTKNIKEISNDNDIQVYY